MDKAKLLIFLSLPAILLIVFVFFFASDLRPILLVGLYLLTLLYVVLYIKCKFSNMWALPVSFFVSPLFIYIFETLDGGLFQGMITSWFMKYYALPFALITAIIAIIIKSK